MNVLIKKLFPSLILMFFCAGEALAAETAASSPCSNPSVVIGDLTSNHPCELTVVPLANNCKAAWRELNKIGISYVNGSTIITKDGQTFFQTVYFQVNPKTARMELTCNVQRSISGADVGLFDDE